MRREDVPPGPLLVDTDVYSWITWQRGRHREFDDLVPQERKAPRRVNWSSGRFISLPSMTDDDRRLAEVRDPEGRAGVLLARIWEEKIARDHPELRDHLERVLGTVTAPDHAEPDPRASRRRYYRRRVGPNRWLLVGRKL